MRAWSRALPRTAVPAVPARSRPHVQVATSCPGRDLKHANPCRDLKSWSRLRFPLPSPKPGRDFIFLGRDLLDDQAKLRHQPHVATSLPALSHKSGCDLKNGVATSVPNRTGRDVDSMSRPPFQSNQNNEVATTKRGRDTKSPVSSCDAKIPKSPSLRPTATQPGHDTTSWSRPQ